MVGVDGREKTRDDYYYYASSSSFLLFPARSQFAPYAHHRDVALFDLSLLFWVGKGGGGCCNRFLLPPLGGSNLVQSCSKLFKVRRDGNTESESEKRIRETVGGKP